MESIDTTVRKSTAGTNNHVASKGPLAALVYVGTSTKRQSETLMLEIEDYPYLFRVDYHNQGINRDTAYTIMNFFYGIPKWLYRTINILTKNLENGVGQQQTEIYGPKGNILSKVDLPNPTKKAEPDQKILYDEKGEVCKRVNPSKEAAPYQRILYDTEGNILIAVNREIKVEGYTRVNLGNLTTTLASRIEDENLVILLKPNPLVLYKG